MEIEVLIFFIDILAAVGGCAYFYKEIKKDLKQLSLISSMIPIIIFGFTMLADIKKLPERGISNARWFKAVGI